MSVIIKLLSKFDDSGIKKAKHGFGGLGKAIAGIGLGIGLKEIGDVLIESAKAASADAKSQQLLRNQLVKNTNATKTQVKGAEKFIQTVSKQVGIIDDDLRPVLGKLARGTGSVTKAQGLLKLALDASTVSGKPLDTVAQALSKAYNGNTSALSRMFPELKKSKDAIGDLRKEVDGAAAQQADPFAKFNVAMDDLKEKLGAIILPYLEQLIDLIIKPGGVADQVGKFLDDVSNPKTDAGKTFIQIKDAIAQTVGGVKDFFALFGNGDAMKGFANVAGSLIKALPALIALKGILMLASAGKSITNLVAAIAALRGVGGGGSPISTFTKSPALSTATKVLVPLAITAASLEVIDSQFSNPENRKKLALHAQDVVKQNQGIFVSKDGTDSSGNPVNINVNVQSADPKAVVDAIGKYVKTNGKLPSYFFPGTK